MSNAENKISIIVITYNNYNDLEKTIASVPDNWKKNIFIVNGGSCELSKHLVRQYNGISEKDKGIADAFNKGVMNSDGNYLHFLNSGDTIIDKTFYDKALSLIEKDSALDFVTSRIMYGHFLGKLIITPSLKFNKFRDLNLNVTHPGTIISRESFHSFGYFNLEFKIAMDFDFFLRMKKNKSRGAFLDVISVDMDGSGVSSENPLAALEEMKKSLKINSCYHTRELLIWNFLKLKNQIANLFLVKKMRIFLKA